MGKGIGRQIQFGIAKEASRGTAEAAATFWIPWTSLALDEKIELAEHNQSLGVVEGSSGASIVKKWAEGSISAPIGDKHFPLILMSLLGALATADNADSDASIKDHTITVGQSAQHQSLTLFLDDPLASADYKHALGVVEEVSIKYEVGKMLEYEAKVRSKTGELVGAGLTPASTSENNFLSQHASFKIASALSGLGAASALTVRSMNIKIAQAIQEDAALGNVGPADYTNGPVTIEGEIEAVWESEAAYKAAVLAGTAKAMRMDLINSDVTIGSAAHPEIRIDLAKVIFSEITKAHNLDDIVMQTLAFKAHYSASDAKMVTILATNAQASY